MKYTSGGLTSNAEAAHSDHGGHCHVHVHGRGEYHDCQVHVQAV